MKKYFLDSSIRIINTLAIYKIYASRSYLKDQRNAKLNIVEYELRTAASDGVQAFETRICN